MRNEQLFEHPLPHSPDAERAVLGAVLINPDLIAQARAMLTPADFYVRAHALVFAALTELDETGTEMGTVLVAERLRASGDLAAVGGKSFVSDLTYGVPFIRNVKHYADAILESSYQRELAKLGAAITSRAQDEPAPEVVEWAVERLFSAQARRTVGARHGVRDAAEMLDPQTARYRQFSRDVSDSISTGFPAIDSNLTGCGFARKRLTLIAARPSGGKTALALDIVANAAGAGHRALMFSLEMSGEMLLDRLVSVASAVPRCKIQAGIAKHDYQSLVSALPTVCDLPIMFDDSSRSIAEIRRVVKERARRAETRPDFVVVDYLQLVEVEGRRGTRNDEVGAVSRALKGLAMEFDVPVLALSQLSRDCERQDREPELRDLRDSGEVEQDADTVLLMFGDKPEEGMSYREITVKCAKQRDGKLFREKMPFNGELVTFRTAS